MQITIHRVIGAHGEYEVRSNGQAVGYINESVRKCTGYFTDDYGVEYVADTVMAVAQEMASDCASI